MPPWAPPPPFTSPCPLSSPGLSMLLAPPSPPLRSSVAVPATLSVVGVMLFVVGLASASRFLRRRRAVSRRGSLLRASAKRSTQRASTVHGSIQLSSAATSKSSLGRVSTMAKIAFGSTPSGEASHWRGLKRLPGFIGSLNARREVRKGELVELRLELTALVRVVERADGKFGQTTLTKLRFGTANDSVLPIAEFSTPLIPSEHCASGWWRVRLMCVCVCVCVCVRVCVCVCVCVHIRVSKTCLCYHA